MFERFTDKARKVVHLATAKATEPADGRGGVPPQRDHGERADPDDGQDRARAYPSAPFLRRNGPWRDLALSRAQLRSARASPWPGVRVSSGVLNRDGSPGQAGHHTSRYAGQAGLAGSYAQPGPYGSPGFSPFSYGYVASPRTVQPPP